MLRTVIYIYIYVCVCVCIYIVISRDEGVSLELSELLRCLCGGVGYKDVCTGDASFVGACSTETFVLSTLLGVWCRDVCTIDATWWEYIDILS